MRDDDRKPQTSVIPAAPGFWLHPIEDREDGTKGFARRQAIIGWIMRVVEARDEDDDARVDATPITTWGRSAWGTAFAIEQPDGHFVVQDHCTFASLEEVLRDLIG